MPEKGSFRKPHPSLKQTEGSSYRKPHPSLKQTEGSSYRKPHPSLSQQEEKKALAPISSESEEIISLKKNEKKINSNDQIIDEETTNSIFSTSNAREISVLKPLSSFSEHLCTLDETSSLDAKIQKLLSMTFPLYPENSEIKIFKFDTLSPDEIVLQSQSGAFGKKKSSQITEN